MTVKWIANIAVVLGCGYIGVVFASRLEARVRQLEALEAMLTQLAFNIGFLALPLSEAMRQTASGQCGVVRRLLEQVTARLSGRPETTMKQAWEEAIRRQAGALCLKQPEMDALYAFAAHLGLGDGRDALDNIQLTAAKLKLARESAQAERTRDGKLCRGLGFLTGMLIVILLF